MLTICVCDELLGPVKCDFAICWRTLVTLHQNGNAIHVSDCKKYATGRFMFWVEGRRTTSRAYAQQATDILLSLQMYAATRMHFPVCD